MESNDLYVVEMRKNIVPKVLPINPAKANDPFYRYKMRQLVIQVVGKGKMIRTSFTNLEDVASDLQVLPDYLPNFFAKSIGATAKYDPKRPERERGSISGEYDVKELSDYLKKFVRTFVLCPQCDYPEFTYIPTQTNVRIKCRSCGWKGDVKSLEMNDKFKRYVLNNPPPKPAKVVETNTKRTTKPVTTGANIAKDGWSEDTSEAAVKKRLEAMVPANLQGLVETEGEQNLSTELKTFAKLHNLEQTSTEISRLAHIHGLDPTKKTQLIVYALFSDLKTIGTAIKENKAILEEYVAKQDQQVVLLEALEDLVNKEQVAEVKTTFVNRFQNLLQLLHDEELLEDESVFKWHKKQGSGGEAGKSLRGVSGPFVKWLQEAESASDDDDEESEEEVKTNGSEDKNPGISIEDEIDAL